MEGRLAPLRDHGASRSGLIVNGVYYTAEEWAAKTRHEETISLLKEVLNAIKERKQQENG